jgi:hypothetical protein
MFAFTGILSGIGNNPAGGCAASATSSNPLASTFVGGGPPPRPLPSQTAFDSSRSFAKSTPHDSTPQCPPTPARTPAWAAGASGGGARRASAALLRAGGGGGGGGGGGASSSPALRRADSLEETKLLVGGVAGSIVHHADAVADALEAARGPPLDLDALSSNVGMDDGVGGGMSIDFGASAAHAHGYGHGGQSSSVEMMATGISEASPSPWGAASRGADSASRSVLMASASSAAGRAAGPGSAFRRVSAGSARSSAMRSVASPESFHAAFRVVRHLGKGSFSRVMEVVDRGPSGTHYAIKQALNPMKSR